MREPYGRNQAKKLVGEILKEGNVRFSKHALEEMKADNLTSVDVTNVLRGGRILDEPEQIKGTWRYRVCTNRIYVVVAFRGTADLTVVTAWRK